MGVDRDRSGAVDGGELQQCLTSFGYRLSPQAIGTLIGRYSTNGQIKFDDFVALNVRLRVLTSESVSILFLIYMLRVVVE